jgi:hypothetical protein
MSEAEEGAAALAEIIRRTCSDKEVRRLAGEAADAVSVRGAEPVLLALAYLALACLSDSDRRDGYLEAAENIIRGWEL